MCWSHSTFNQPPVPRTTPICHLCTCSTQDRHLGTTHTPHKRIYFSPCCCLCRYLFLFPQCTNTITTTRPPKTTTTPTKTNDQYCALPSNNICRTHLRPTNITVVVPRHEWYCFRIQSHVSNQSDGDHWNKNTFVPSIDWSIGPNVLHWTHGNVRSVWRTGQRNI